MGAPHGNKNAAGPHKKGWYRTSGSRRTLGRVMGPYARKQRDWYVSSRPFSERKRARTWY